MYMYIYIYIYMYRDGNKRDNRWERLSVRKAVRCAHRTRFTSTLHPSVTLVANWSLLR